MLTDAATELLARIYYEDQLPSEENSRPGFFDAILLPGGHRFDDSTTLALYHFFADAGYPVLIEDGGPDAVVAPL